MSEVSTNLPVSIFDPSYWEFLWRFDNMATAPPRPAPFGTSTVMMVLFFGTNFLLFLYFYAVKQSAAAKDDDGEALQKKEKKGKELSKPFNGTVDCFSNLTHELLRTGLIMGMTYVCEYLWIFPHSTKSYSRDLFLFVLILFFAYAIYTIKPVHDLSLLGREQTEEWKGWMQFIFLLYHYFHAEEVYNSVRVMITCYVWMTGFGNFSFFYMKGDYSWLRLVQMLWRLNFSVLLLMWTHGNTYILYYICPLHTFYFLMVYATMYIFSSINTSKWGIRFKLFALALIIYLVWDINDGLFDKLFVWLGTDKIIGASNGSVWEWYFRTSLDHWSTLLGMIFALNFPLAEQYFKTASGPSLWIGSILMGGVTLWWVYYYFPLDKLSYNLTHSYLAIIPLTSYIFFRNITPAVRSGVSMSLHDLGKTTLETYLLQHHIWLSSNAKTLWTLTPGNPWINFALATVVFFVASKELYRLTMTLRGMILPDDNEIAKRNGLGAVAVLAVCGAVAYALVITEANLWAILLTCFGLAAAVLLLLSRITTSAADQALHQQHQSRFLKLFGVGAAVCFAAVLIHRGSSAATTDAASGVSQLSAATIAGRPSPSLYRGNQQECLDQLSKGHWAIAPCTETNDKLQAACTREQWTWEAPPAECPIHRYTPSSLQSLLRNKQVVFAGDSIVRSAYHGFLSVVEPTYQQNHSSSLKHQDIHYQTKAVPGAVFSFYWMPFVSNLTTALLPSPERNPLTQSTDLLVLGASLWDALYYHDASRFTRDVDHLVQPLSAVNSSRTIKLWLLPTTILDERLTSEDKRQYMNEPSIARYRQAVKTSSKVRQVVHGLVDPSSVSVMHEHHSIDGVHYTEDVYQVVAQMLANAYALQFPKLHLPAAAKPYVPKTTGAMSFPSYGAMVLALVAVMLFLMDSFLGIGYLSLRLGGKAYDWDAAYGPLHAKLGINGSSSHSVATRVELAENARAERAGLLTGEEDRQSV